MRKLSLLFAAFSFLAFPLVAQNSRVDVFGGFQYLRDGNVDGSNDGLSAFGWNGSAAFYFTRHLGAAADFSGSYRSGTITNASLGEGGRFPVQFHAYTYAFGPVLNLNPGGRIRPFVHALFGQAELKPDGCLIFSGSPDECGSGTYSGLTVLVGGGVDAAYGGHWSYRILQADWVHLPAFDAGQNNNIRISTGVVFRF